MKIHFKLSVLSQGPEKKMKEEQDEKKRKEEEEKNKEQSQKQTRRRRKMKARRKRRMRQKSLQRRETTMMRFLKMNCNAGVDYRPHSMVARENDCSAFILNATPLETTMMYSGKRANGSSQPIYLICNHWPLTSQFFVIEEFSVQYQGSDMFDIF